MFDKEQIRASIDVEKLYTSELGYPPTRTDPKSLTYLCPFHPDKNNPNLRVNTESNNHRGGFKCFACDAKGDVFAFVMKLRKIDFAEALKVLADRAGLPVNERPREKPKTAEMSSVTCDLNHEYESWPDDLKDWIAGRGITAETAKQFNLAHAVYQDRYHALAIPYGEPKHDGYYKLRFYKGDYTHKFTVWPSGRPQRLFGLPIEKDTILLVEGELDALRLAQEPTGASILSPPHGAETFKAEWADQLRGKDVAIIFDRDAVGQKGAKKAAGMISGRVTSVCIVELPDGEYGKDVTEYLQAGHDGTDIVALVAGTPSYEPPPVEATKEKTAKGKLSGQGIALPEPEPWPEPVDGAELLEELVTAFEKYIVLPDCAAEALALWVVHTHTIDTAYITPRLALLSPDKRCGKTLTLEILDKLVWRPLRTDNITAAAFYRTVEKSEPTALIDEADSFFKKDKEELSGVLNSGHRRGGYVILCVGKDFEPRQFATFAPVAIAKIGEIPWSTLEDRSIIVRMHRKTKDEKVESLRIDRTPDLDRLARMVARWAEDNLEALAEADPETPGGLHDRAADNWRHLLAIADLAGGPWPEGARAVAVALSGGAEAEDSSQKAQLLIDIQQIFATRNTDRLKSKAICGALAELEDRSWPEYSRGAPITPTQLARLLKDFEIGPKTLRFEEETKKGYELADFAETFERYIPPIGAVTPLQVCKNKNLRENPPVTQPPDVTGKKEDKASKNNNVTAVTARAGGVGVELPLFDRDG